MLFVFRCKSIAECAHTEQIHDHNLTQWYKVNNDREKPCLVELTANYSSQKDKLFTMSFTFAIKALNPSCNVTTAAVCVCSLQIKFGQVIQHVQDCLLDAARIEGFMWR